MELSGKAQNNLKDLMSRTIYLTEKNLYLDIFDILKEDLDFFYDVKLSISDQFNEASFNIENRILAINIEENYCYAKKYAYSWLELLNPEDIEEFTKYAIALVILHESAHSEQSACAYDDYSAFSEVNQLYRKIFEFDVWWNIPFQVNYWLRGDTFSFERNANLCAFREILSIAPDKYQEIFKLEYIYNYLKNYYVKGNRIITPARKTFKMICRKYDIIDKEIPVDVRITHGLDLNSEEYNKYIYDIDNLGIAGSTFDEVQRMLRKKE